MYGSGGIFRGMRDLANTQQSSSDGTTCVRNSLTGLVDQFFRGIGGGEINTGRGEMVGVSEAVASMLNPRQERLIIDVMNGRGDPRTLNFLIDYRNQVMERVWNEQEEASRIASMGPPIGAWRSALRDHNSRRLTLSQLLAIKEEELREDTWSSGGSREGSSGGYREGSSEGPNELENYKMQLISRALSDGHYDFVEEYVLSHPESARTVLSMAGPTAPKFFVSRLIELINGSFGPGSFGFSRLFGNSKSY
jgi:hypothetical protein